MHISNRHMELAKVVASVAASEGLVTFGKADDQANTFSKDFRANALVAVLARRAADLGPLPHGDWEKAGAPKIAPWTDDYSDIMARSCARSCGRRQPASSSSMSSASITESRRTSERPMSP
jgi:hypothetical protein